VGSATAQNEIVTSILPRPSGTFTLLLLAQQRSHAPS
jgi:hypothetical protein